MNELKLREYFKQQLFKVDTKIEPEPEVHVEEMIVEEHWYEEDEEDSSSLQNQFVGDDVQQISDGSVEADEIPADVAIVECATSDKRFGATTTNGANMSRKKSEQLSAGGLFDDEYAMSLELEEEYSKVVKRAKCINGRWQCEFCERSFSWSKTFRPHIRVHLGLNCVKCTVCDRKFPMPSYLTAHMKSHGPRTAKLKKRSTAVYICDICGKQYTTKYGIL